MRSQVSPTHIDGKTIKRSGKGPNAKSTLSSLSGVSKSSESKLKQGKIDAKKERKFKVSDYPNAPMKSKNAQECFMEANREGQLRAKVSFIRQFLM